MLQPSRRRSSKQYNRSLQKFGHSSHSASSGISRSPVSARRFLQLGDMVELKGFLPQREALAMMNETDYVLLLNHDPLNVGGKFYDYVGGGKPILGAVHAEGESCRLLEELRAGWWADIESVEGIRQLFLDAAKRGDPLLSEFRPDQDKIDQYERRALAKRYAALLRSIVFGPQPLDAPEPLAGVVEEARQ